MNVRSQFNNIFLREAAEICLRTSLILTLVLLCEITPNKQEEVLSYHHSSNFQKYFHQLFALETNDWTIYIQLRIYVMIWKNYLIRHLVSGVPSVLDSGCLVLFYNSSYYIIYYFIIQYFNLVRKISRYKIRRGKI